jgi:ATP-dependent RNA circularization protein (DNA/RNA ligase family)
MANYKSYLHVERLEKEECEGLLQNDIVYVTAKIDGTNACVWLGEDGQVHAGSRKRELNENKDNADFYSWVQSNNNEAISLRQALADHPTWILYGEWMGFEKFVGSIKTYDDCAKGHMYLFDVFDTETLEYLPDHVWRIALTKYGLHPYMVELLATLSHPSYQDIVDVAEENKFLLTHAENKGEGVVCKAPGWKNKYGHTCYGKVVLDEFHQHKRQGRHRPQITREGVEHDIVEYFVTDAEMAKAKAKVCIDCNVDEFNVKSGKMIGMYLNYCWNDLLEEIKMICKKYKNPIIDFKVLNAEVKNQARKYIGLI